MYPATPHLTHQERENAMPYLDVKISGTPAADITQQVADRLADLTTTILHKKRELTSITVTYVDGRQWYVAGTPITAQEQTTFYLAIHVTDGTNTKDEKAAYIKQVFASMQSILGKLHPASYVVIKDVGADSWGYEGATQEFRYVKGKSL
jgi:4-oxalocrotonate tautomerase